MISLKKWILLTSVLIVTFGNVSLFSFSASFDHALDVLEQEETQERIGMIAADTTSSVFFRLARLVLRAGNNENKEIREEIGEALGAIGGNIMSSTIDSSAKEVRASVGAGSALSTTLQEFTNTVNRDVFNKILVSNGIRIVAIGAAFFAVQYSIPMFIRLIERSITTPSLIIESSKKSIKQRIGSLFTKTQEAPVMVFTPSLEKQLQDLISVTKMINTKIKSGKTNVKYRNLLLYGPPGTGKTMFAKKLAQLSGMEYAYMSGSSFSKFKDGEGIQALDELFAWAKKSKGLIIFIDEAEAFLLKRDSMDPQSKAYQLLNNFLNYTGERSANVMFIFATNHRDSLDSAMYRRIDDAIEMPLPSKAERIKTLQLYTKKILLDDKQNDEKSVAAVKKHMTDAVIKDIAERTRDFSYGELEGLINTLKTDADILEFACITPALIQDVVERAIKKHAVLTNGKPLGYTED